jgi:hypothetical protein
LQLFFDLNLPTFDLPDRVVRDTRGKRFLQSLPDFTAENAERAREKNFFSVASAFSAVQFFGYFRFAEVFIFPTIVLLEVYSRSFIYYE